MTIRGRGPSKGPRWAMATCLLLGFVPVSAMTEDDLQDADAEAEQTVLPDPVEQAPEPRARVIEEIIVTATKREASVRDVAGSVTALTGEQLEDAGLQDINDIVDAVPGVNLVGSSTDAVEPDRITIRGISAGRGQNDTVGIFIDETPFTDAFRSIVTADANPFDMSAVEVLKGPVGTLFGGSALNGAVRYIPQRPVFGEWQTKVFGQYNTNAESDDIGQVAGVAVNVPILESVALRIVGNDRRSEGWIDSLNQSYKAKDVNKVTQRNVRAILRWQALEPLDVSLMFLNQDTRLHDLGFADTCCGGGFERTAMPRPSPSETSYSTWQLKGTWAFDWADLVLVASDSDKQANATPDGSFIAESDPYASTLSVAAQSEGHPRSQELRLVSAPGGDWDWLAGVFNYQYDIVAAIDILTGDGAGGAEALPTDLEADVSEKAFFGEVNWRFAGGLELTGGLRLYEFSYSGIASSEGPGCVLTDPTCPATGLQGVVELDKTERGASPKLSLKWDILDNAMTYASIARGFRFGGVNPTNHPEIPPVFDSDSLWNYELGVRTELFDDRLIADAAAFAIDWDNAQLGTVTSDGVVAYIDNVGAVEGRGIETQFIWRTPIHGVTLNMTSAYARIVTAKDYTQPSATGGGQTTPRGSPWPRAPKWQTATAVTWDGRVGATSVGTSLTHSYFGKAIQGFLPLDGSVFGYSTYDLQFTAKSDAVPWLPDLAININNLTNKQGTTFSQGGIGPNSGNIRRYTTPRSIVMRLGFNFR